MAILTARIFEKRISAMRKQLIANLKTIIGKNTLNVYDNDVFINNSNTEDLFRTFDKDGGETEYDNYVPWKEMSTDLLILIVKVLHKNIKKLK